MADPTQATSNKTVSGVREGKRVRVADHDGMPWARIFLYCLLQVWMGLSEVVAFQQEEVGHHGFVKKRTTNTLPYCTHEVTTMTGRFGSIRLRTPRRRPARAVDTCVEEVDDEGNPSDRILGEFSSIISGDSGPRTDNARTREISLSFRCCFLDTANKCLQV